MRPTPAPATPMIRDRFETRPSLMPKIAARRARSCRRRDRRPPRPGSPMRDDPRAALISGAVRGGTGQSRRLGALRALRESVAPRRGLAGPQEPLELRASSSPVGMSVDLVPARSAAALQPVDVLGELGVLRDDAVDPLGPAHPPPRARSSVRTVDVDQHRQPLDQRQGRLRVGAARQVVGDRRPQADRGEAGAVGRLVEDAHDAGGALVSGGGHAQPLGLVRRRGRARDPDRRVCGRSARNPPSVTSRSHAEVLRRGDDRLAERPPPDARLQAREQDDVALGERRVEELGAPASRSARVTRRRAGRSDG